MMSKCTDFIQELFTLTEAFDGDGNGLCGESYEEVVKILKEEYPILFESYEMLKAAEENGITKMKMKNSRNTIMGEIVNNELPF